MKNPTLINLDIKSFEKMKTLLETMTEEQFQAALWLVGHEGYWNRGLGIEYIKQQIKRERENLKKS